MKGTPLFFDYQATTPCSQEVLEAMQPYWNEQYGNPSSRQNQPGIFASAAISVARDEIASYLSISPERLIFTSGATEANNLALLGHARAKALETGLPGHLITLSTEHKAVLDPIDQLQKEGFRVTKLDPDKNGLVSLDKLKNAFEKDTFLVSIMLANNEIGVLQPIKEISYLCRERGLTLHSDAAQAFGYIDIDIDYLDIDLMSISSHKIYGPKGIGLLIRRENLPIQALQWGGGQENGIRPGTEPVPLIIGLAKACEIAINKMDFYANKFKVLRDKLWCELNQNIPDLFLNGSFENRLPNNLNFTVYGVKGNQLHNHLRPLISCSSGSACSQGEPSHVLLSIGRSLKEAEASLRLSIGRETTLNDIDQAVTIISKVVRDLRN